MKGTSLSKTTPTSPCFRLSSTQWQDGEVRSLAGRDFIFIKLTAVDKGKK